MLRQSSIPNETTGRPPPIASPGLGHLGRVIAEEVDRDVPPILLFYFG